MSSGNEKIFPSDIMEAEKSLGFKVVNDKHHGCQCIILDINDRYRIIRIKNPAGMQFYNVEEYGKFLNTTKWRPSMEWNNAVITIDSIPDVISKLSQ